MTQPISSSCVRDHIVVCGLGSLGQHCVSVLKEFGVVVSAIEIAEILDWEINDLPTQVDTLVRGDCCQPKMLEAAGVPVCRAVLLVTSTESVNIEAAFAVRLMNPRARIIVRSSKQNLNQLISTHLGDFLALEATLLSAPAFAIAALGSEMRGFINLAGSLLRVVKVQITAHHPWCDRKTVHDLNSPTRRILSHIPAQMNLPTQFHTWQPDRQLRSGDLVAYVEVFEGRVIPSMLPLTSNSSGKSRWTLKPIIARFQSRHALTQQLITFWKSTAQHQSKRVAIVVGIVILIVFILGMVILKLTYPDQNNLALFYTVGVMLLGAYDAVFTVFDPASPIPLWLRLMNLIYMLIGTASIAVLYALLTERLLAAKFQLPKKRPPIPTQNHVVLIGLGRVGQRVATLLQQLNQPFVAVTREGLPSTLLPTMPVVVGELPSALTKVNLETARSVVVVTDDEMENLEIGLMTHAANPGCATTIRVFTPQFGESIRQLVPFAKVLSAYALSAEAFVATVFGENVLSLIRLNEQTVLVTEYEIVMGDTLDGLLLAEIAYGYDVVPISHQKGQEPIRLMPSDDLRVQAGDRLVVLATLEGLQQIERGDRKVPSFGVKIEKVLTKDAVFDGERVIAMVTGCPIYDANQWMKQLPQCLPMSLYSHQAQRLVRELRKAQVIAEVISIEFNRIG